MWLLFSLASALLLAVRRVYEKKLTAHFGNFSLSFLFVLFSLFFTFLLLFLFPLPNAIGHLPARFWSSLLIIWIVLYPLQNYLLYRALREGELSQVTPISALLPVFNILTSLVILDEVPGFVGFIGILFSVAGTYVLLSKGGGVLAYERPVLYMVGSVACTALGSTLDKVAVTASSPVFYTFVNLCGAAVVFYLLAWRFGERHELKRVPEFFWSFCIVGAVFALAFASYASAFALGKTSYVLAIQTGGYLAAALWGILAMRERPTMRKIIAFVLFICGMGLLALT